MKGFPSRAEVDSLKKRYPPGTRIRLNHMDDPYAPVPDGTTGVVKAVDDAGQLIMAWDNGRSLSLVPGVDSFSVIQPELTTLKLYMPMSVEIYERNEWGDLENEPLDLDGAAAQSYLKSYADKLLAALVRNRKPEEAERGIMRWYHDDDAVAEKVRTCVFTIDERDDKLWCIAECRIAGELSPEELTKLKDFVEGQCSDGWGEGFEQREIPIDEGEMYVHLWGFSAWNIKTEQERFNPKIAEGLPELCFSTLKSTGDLICIKRGETGYYPSDWSTSDKERKPLCVLVL